MIKDPCDLLDAWAMLTGVSSYLKTGSRITPATKSANRRAFAVARHLQRDAA